MKRLFQLSLVSFALVLSGCQNEAENTPDITEAIPLDGVETSEDSAAAKGAGTDASSGNSSSQSAGSSEDERSLPDTMESGSNPSDMTEPPAGSKVQRIN